MASFFVSRVDTAVDKLLEQKGNKDLQGKIAVANAKEAYQIFLRSLETDKWKKLEAKGATRQRPLWASTGTKNPASTGTGVNVDGFAVGATPVDDRASVVTYSSWAGLRNTNASGGSVRRSLTPGASTTFTSASFVILL